MKSSARTKVRGKKCGEKSCVVKKRADMKLISESLMGGVGGRQSADMTLFRQSMHFVEIGIPIRTHYMFYYAT